LDIKEIQSIDCEEVAVQKAKEAYEILGTPVLVEDSGLGFEELNGFPGALVNFTLDGLGNAGLCNLVNINRNATGTTVLAYYDGGEVRTFEGTVDGNIVESSRGFNGFGWDPIFSPEGFDETFAEMSAEEKNDVSMRRSAFEKFAEFFEE